MSTSHDLHNFKQMKQIVYFELLSGRLSSVVFFSRVLCCEAFKQDRRRITCRKSSTGNATHSCSYLSRKLSVRKSNAETRLQSTVFCAHAQYQCTGCLEILLRLCPNLRATSFGLAAAVLYVPPKIHPKSSPICSSHFLIKNWVMSLNINSRISSH